MRSATLLAASILLALALGAASAGATTFCVDAPTCIGTEKATIKDALDTAALNGNGADTVHIGTNGGAPYAEAISYTDPEVVHIIGEGRGETIVEAGAGSVSATLLSPGSTIESMTLRVPDTNNGMGLRWDATATDLQIVHSGSTATTTLGMRAEGNAVLASSTVSIQGFGMFETLNAGTVKIEDSTLIGAGRGISLNGGGLTIERSTIASKATVLFAGGANVNVYDTVLRLTDTAATTAAAVSAPSGADVVLRHATLVGAGQGRAVTVGADAGSSSLAAFDSILDGFQLAVLCLGTSPHTATFAISYSDVTDGTNVTDPECASTFGAGNVDVDPQFVSPDSLLPILRLEAGSPLVDAGDPADPLTVDFAGDPRKVDGDGDGTARSDIGAYEYQRQAPVPKLTATQNPNFPSQFHFSADGSTDRDPGDVLSYSWDFGFRTVTGEEVEEVFPPGPHKVTLTVTDSAGASASTTADVFAPYPIREPNEPPSLSKVRAVPKRIVIGKTLPKLRAGSKKGIRFTIEGTSKVTLFLNRCKRKPGCTDLAKVPGSATFTATPGAHTISFAGRFKAKKPLAPGRYVARLRLAGGDVYSTRIDLVAPSN